MSDLENPESGSQSNALNGRIVRYADLKPCLNAFIDTRTPGSSEKENFTIIGPGVSENPAQHVHIGEPHGFNIGGARQPPRCVNSQHSHLTAEVFVVHSGQWRFMFGENGQDAAIFAQPGDVVSFPTHAFRGFENTGDDVGFLWSVLGGDDPGRVTWAPRVFEMAKQYGLVLLENGSLVDIAAGEKIPDDAAPMQPTSAAEVAAMKRMSNEKAEQLRADRYLRYEGTGGLNSSQVTEVPIIGLDATLEGLPAGPLDWPHGFQLRKLCLETGAEIGEHIREEAEVIFVHSGSLFVTMSGQTEQVLPGDTVTIPIGNLRSYRAGEDTTLFVVRGGDNPSAPIFAMQ